MQLMNPPELGGLSWNTTQIGELNGVGGANCRMLEILLKFSIQIYLHLYMFPLPCLGAAVILFQVFLYDKLVKYFGLLNLLHWIFPFQVQDFSSLFPTLSFSMS